MAERTLEVVGGVAQGLRGRRGRHPGAARRGPRPRAGASSPRSWARRARARARSCNLIGLLDRPTGGRSPSTGSDIGALDDDALTRYRGRTLGFVFQFHHLLPEFTALENVMLPMMADRGRADAEHARVRARTSSRRSGSPATPDRRGPALRRAAAAGRHRARARDGAEARPRRRAHREPRHPERRRGLRAAARVQPRAPGSPSSSSPTTRGSPSAATASSSSWTAGSSPIARTGGPVNVPEDIRAAARRALALPDAALAAECEETFFIASGPGGQHRNKTESGVRLVAPADGHRRDRDRAAEPGAEPRRRRSSGCASGSPRSRAGRSRAARRARPADRRSAGSPRRSTAASGRPRGATSTEAVSGAA